MGLRFKKSINLGGGARVNLSKSGVGFSIGTKGARVTKKSNGGTRSTLSIPGTGISYVKDSSNSAGKQASKNGAAGKNSSGEPKKRKTWLWVLGWLLIFPVPLSILLLRKREMNVAIKTGILAVAWIFYLIIAIGGTSGSSSKNTEEETGTNVDLSETSINEENQESSAIETIEVNSITLHWSEENLILGEDSVINATIIPDNANDKSLVWSTSDENVVAVDQNGNIIAVGGGQAVITAQSSNGVTSTCNINVDGTKRTMKLRVTRSRDDKNNIGDEWSYINQINGENTTKDYVLSVGDRLEFYSKITELDEKPDIGEATASHVVTEEDIMNGLAISMDVYVTENAGRNSGKSAHFIVTYHFEIK